MNKIPDEEFEIRINKLRKCMEKEKIDMLLIYGNDFYSANIRYLVDFWPSFEEVLLILDIDKEIVIAGSPEIEYYKLDSARFGKVVNIAEFIIEGEETPNIITSSLKEIIFETLSNKKNTKFGLIGFSYVSKNMYDLILKSINKKEISDFSFLLEGQNSLRSFKSQNEINMIKKSYELSEKGMEYVFQNLKEGIAEYELAAEVEYLLRKNGADGFAFDTMIASGSRSNTVVGRATEKIINKNELIMVSIGAKYQGYASSIGRPFYIGKPNNDLKAFLNLGEEAAKISEEKLIPGNKASEVDLVARDYIKKRGYGKYHLYSVGHGLGLNEVEEPFCTPNTNYNLNEGNVISIDIGLFGNKEFGGYRYEEGFYLTEKEAIPLCNFMRKTI